MKPAELEGIMIWCNIFKRPIYFPALEGNFEVKAQPSGKLIAFCKCKCGKTHRIKMKEE